MKVKSTYSNAGGISNPDFTLSTQQSGLEIPPTTYQIIKMNLLKAFSIHRIKDNNQ